jgi:hypothetical protein
MNANALVASEIKNAFQIFIHDLMLFIKGDHSVPDNKDVYLRGIGYLQMENTKTVLL